MAAFNKIKGFQIDNKAVSLAHLADDVTAKFTGWDNSIQNILDTMSTDEERIAAIAALTEAMNNADSDLTSAMQALATKIGTAVGLNADHTYKAEAGANYIAAATSTHDATVKLDTQVKKNADDLAAEVVRATAKEAELQAAIDALNGDTGKTTNLYGANIAIEDAAVVADQANLIAVTKGDIDFAMPVKVYVNGQLLTDTAMVKAVEGQAKQIDLTEFVTASDAVIADLVAAKALVVEYFFR
jgi:hypothetical protein